MIRSRRLLATLEECPASGCEFCHLRGGCGELWTKAHNISSELLRQCRRQWIGRDRFQLQRIEPLAVIGNAVIEMRTGRQAGRTDISDQLPLRHFCAAANTFSKSRQMEVVRVDARSVMN